MCELLGISAKQRRAVTAILREFFSHAEKHPHGWGLARFADTEGPRLLRPPPCRLKETLFVSLSCVFLFFQFSRRLDERVGDETREPFRAVFSSPSCPHSNVTSMIECGVRVQSDGMS